MAKGLMTDIFAHQSPASIRNLHSYNDKLVHSQMPKILFCLTTDELFLIGICPLSKHLASLSPPKVTIL